MSDRASHSLDVAIGKEADLRLATLADRQRASAVWLPLDQLALVRSACRKEI